MCLPGPVHIQRRGRTDPLGIYQSTRFLGPNDRMEAAGLLTTVGGIRAIALPEIDKDRPSRLVSVVNVQGILQRHCRMIPPNYSNRIRESPGVGKYSEKLAKVSISLMRVSFVGEATRTNNLE